MFLVFAKTYINYSKIVRACRQTTIKELALADDRRTIEETIYRAWFVLHKNLFSFVVVVCMVHIQSFFMPTGRQRSTDRSARRGTKLHNCMPHRTAPPQVAKLNPAKQSWRQRLAGQPPNPDSSSPDASHAGI